MDKKDIYEHLASIYLDASSKRKKKSRGYPGFLKGALSFILVAGVALILFKGIHKTANDSETALVFVPDAAKINYHFDPARKETFTIALNKLDMGRFRAVAFSAKKVNYANNIFLRIEFTNVFQEKSEIYLKDISSKWQDYRIDLSKFKNISDWSSMSELAFVVEEWNAQGKKGVVYIHNVRILK